MPFIFILSNESKSSSFSEPPFSYSPLSGDGLFSGGLGFLTTGLMLMKAASDLGGDDDDGMKVSGCGGDTNHPIKLFWKFDEKSAAFQRICVVFKLILSTYEVTGWCVLEIDLNKSKPPRHIHAEFYCVEYS